MRQDALNWPFMRSNGQPYCYHSQCSYDSLANRWYQLALLSLPRGPPPPPSCPCLEPINHKKTRPLLLIVFTKIGSHHSMEDFVVRGKESKDEVQIYTWKDATLRELTNLVKEVALTARRRNAKLSFAFVFPDKNDRFKV
ncbi:Histone deacetylase complex subunit SAP18 [Glycine soja]